MDADVHVLVGSCSPHLSVHVVYPSSAFFVHTIGRVCLDISPLGTHNSARGCSIGTRSSPIHGAIRIYINGVRTTLPEIISCLSNITSYLHMHTASRSPQFRSPLPSLHALNGNACNFNAAGRIYPKKVIMPIATHNMLVI